jgi:hypothetical protein
MRLAQRSSIIAVALAVAAIAAPAASARFDLVPAGAQSGSAVSPITSASPAVRPNPDQQSARAGVVGPPLLQRVAPSEREAINRAEAQQERALAYSPSRSARYSSATTNAYASSARPVAVSDSTVKAPGSGFDFGAAAIGAGVIATLALLVTAGTLAVRRRTQLQHS